MSVATEPPPGYRIRPATLADADDIVALRRLMFEEMGRGEPAELERMEGDMRAYLARALPAGEFFAWMVEDEAGAVASMGAAVIRQAPPTVHNHTGREAYVMNVCTYPQHRRRGLARWVMQTIIEWARTQGVGAVTLRASSQGRRLYEQMGFEPTTEMKLRLE
jgi:GNAT superfamily N-acetyltransferase